MTTPLRPLAVLAVVFCVACSSLSSRSPQVLPASEQVVDTARVSTPIKHVVIVVQENRSFNMIFAGFRGAKWAITGKNSEGQTVNLKPIYFRDRHGDIGHSYNIAVRAWDGGKMDAFDKNFISLTSSPAGDYPYSYLKHSEVEPYWAMAARYALDDMMFPEEWGASFTGHQYLISGTTEVSSTSSAADNPNNPPWGCAAPPGTTTDLASMRPSGGPGALSLLKGPFPCYTHVSMANVLDAKSISWKYYAPAINSVGDPGGTLWTAFSAIKPVWDGPDRAKIVSPPQAILTDAANGTLPDVSWVIPDYKNSDHPAARSNTGPAWVASVVNAIGRSQYWNSTAIFVVWDDYGGWFDPVPPPQLDYLGLAIRVPCIVVSPYAKTNYVDHTQYEFASILKTIEQIFGTAPMGTTDVRATSMFGDFDFTQAPRKFVPVPALYSESYFRTMPASGIAPDNE